MIWHMVQLLFSSIFKLHIGSILKAQCQKSYHVINGLVMLAEDDKYLK